jgi:hypothetical protein
MQRGGVLVGRITVPHPVWNEIGVEVAESPTTLKTAVKSRPRVGELERKLLAAAER